jgi:hypothetical protein
MAVEDNTTAAAIAAIVVTNIILVGYILTALAEKDDSNVNSISSGSSSTSRPIPDAKQNKKIS